MLSIPQMTLSQVLQKEHKTTEDAKFIYQKIRKFEFFNSFFTENLRTMEFGDIISLCRKFNYDHVPAGKFVFNQGDPSNNKFYVVISGQIAIIKTGLNDQPFASTRSRGESKTKGPSNKPKKSKGVLFKKVKAVTLLLKKKKTSEETEKEEDVTEIVSDPTFQTWLQYMMEVKKMKDRKQRELLATTTRRAQERTARFEEDARISNEEVVEKALKDEHELDAYMSKLGILVSCKSEGEGFGSLALKNDGPRAASIFCKTDCEFLIITKQQFDLLFLKKERDKEDFLKEVFPFIPNLISSSSNFNNLFFSFQTEVFTKGAYLTVEGKIDNTNPKLFILSRGDCIVEKSSVLESNEALDRKQSNVVSSQPFNIAFIGKGAVVGEEILLNPEEYCYSVKVTSEFAIAYTITLVSFSALFFAKEFKSFLLQLYKKKQSQRLIITENVRRDQESKAIKQRVDRNNARITTFIKSQAGHSLVNDIGDFKTPGLNTNMSVGMLQKNAFSPAKSRSLKLDSLSKSMKLNSGESMNISSEELNKKIVSSTKDAMRMFKAVDLYNPKNQKLISRLGYLNGVHNSVKQESKDYDDNDFEAKRFFNMEDINLSKNSRIRRDRGGLGLQTLNGSPFSNQKSEGLERITSVLKDVAQVARRYKLPNYNTDEDSGEVEYKEKTPEARKTPKISNSSFIHTSNLAKSKNKTLTPSNKGDKSKYKDETFSSYVFQDQRHAPPVRKRSISSEKYCRPGPRLQTSGHFSEVSQSGVFKPVSVTNLAFEQKLTDDSVELVSAYPKHRPKVKSAAGFIFKERSVTPSIFSIKVNSKKSYNAF